jgi:hypothetical protein
LRVPLIHAADLRQAHVGFVHESQELLREEIQEHRGPLPFLPAAEVPGIILYARAVSHLLEHLQVVFGACLDALRLQELSFVAELPIARGQLVPDELERGAEPLLRHYEILGGIDGGELQILDRVSGERIDPPDPLDLISEELDPQRVPCVGGVDLQHVPADSEPRTLESSVVALVLLGDQPAHDLPHVHRGAFDQLEAHLPVVLGVSQPVDAGHRGHHDHVAAFHQRGGGGEPHPLDLLVDGGVLLDVEVLARNVCLGLVVVVVGDEILHRVVGEEVLELPVELGGQRLVVREHEGRELRILDELGHGEGLARPGHAPEGLEAQVVLDPLGQERNGLSLVPGRGE